MTTIIGISGSLRRGSYNTSLLRAAAQLMPDNVQLRIETIRGSLSTMAISKLPKASRNR
jgi:NAD(P)H-dependent FMN reductase